MAHAALIHPIREWLIDQALGAPDPVVLFENMCQRLAGIGIPISRARLIWQTLHPLFRAETVIWDRGQPAKLDTFPHQDNETPAWTNSPLRFVIHNNISVLRRRFPDPAGTEGTGRHGLSRARHRDHPHDGDRSREPQRSARSDRDMG
jgi:adenylate cyclase